MIKDERLSHTKEIEPKREKSNPQYCGVFAVLALSRGQALRLDSRAIAKQKSLVDAPAMAVMQGAMIV